MVDPVTQVSNLHGYVVVPDTGNIGRRNAGAVPGRVPKINSIRELGRQSRRIDRADGIAECIGVAVGADAGLAGIRRIGLDEARQHRVVIAGVEIEQAGVVVVALADIALALGDAGNRDQPLAIGAVVGAPGDGAGVVALDPEGAQIVAGDPGRGAEADPPGVAGQIFDGGRADDLDIGAQIDRGGGAGDLLEPGPSGP